MQSMSSVGGAETVGPMAGSSSLPQQQQKRRWIKYYCEECQVWETREMFEVVKFDRGPPSPSPAGSSCAVWSWGCAKLIRHGTFQSFRVEHLNNADGHDAAPNKLDFPSTVSNAQPSPTQQPVPEVPTNPNTTEAAEAVSALQQTTAAQSHGSSQQSKRPKRTAYALDNVTSPIHSQGGVTSSSPDGVLPDENGARAVHVENRSSKDAEDAAVAAVVTLAAAAAAVDTARPESPAVIDAEHDHENGVHKRPRRITAGDRRLAQALQNEKPRKAIVTKAVAEVHDVKPSQSSLAAAMKRPKRVTAGLKGMALAAENAKSAPRVSVKKEAKKDAVHQVSVQIRSAIARAPSKKNKRLGNTFEDKDVGSPYMQKMLSEQE